MNRKVTTLGMMLALALVLAYIEAIVPMPFGVPGMKLGLPNLMTVLLLYTYGWKEAILVNLLRIFLSGFMFGGMSAILFSLAGALVSFLVMLLLKKTDRFGAAGVSAAGGVAHNVGQMGVAAMMVKTAGVLYFAAPLLIAGCLTGAAIGAAATALLPYLKRIIK